VIAILVVKNGILHSYPVPIRMRLFYGILFLLLFPAFIRECEKSPQNTVEIPDPAFLNALISRGIDNNHDGLISHAEAEAIEFLLLPPSGITDLKGLEAFVNLDSLTITLNSLKAIDLSSNSALRYLDITYCELRDLDLGGNPQLETLICSRNSLTALDLSNNRELKTLVINNNQLSSLDLSPVRSLTTLITCGNEVRYLDISMHPELTKIGVDNMPMLTEVCVWTLPFPPEGILVLQEFSPNIQYTTNCSR
jgi:Leucine-rich repeat (LRR) protein